MSLMSEREALDLYEAVRYNLPNSKFKEAVDIAFCALVKQIVPDTNVGRKTNADHIRSMTDEEMETELLPLFEELCEDGIPSPEYMRFWLKQPYKEDA